MGIRLSIIIPVLNERKNLEELLPFLKGVGEIIISDAGSTDGTAEWLRNKDVVYINGKQGRGVQCNAGACRAKGQVLYFLHADGRPPSDFGSDILAAVDQGAVSGCFRMKWNDRHWMLNFFSWFTRFFGWRFRGGDQSLFVRKKAFISIGGYKEMPLFEDVEIIERLSKEGRFKVIKRTILTSSRRYRQVGVLRLQWYYIVLHAMYRFGWPIEQINERYNNTVGRAWT